MRVLVLEWTPLLGVGIVSLNRAHKELIRSYNELIEILVRDSGRRFFLSAFEQFRECAERHFAHEELVMRNIQYTGYLSHKAAHDRLRVDERDFLLNIEGAYTRNDLPVVARYFRYWLIYHMVVEDAKIAAFVERGWETSALGPPRHEEDVADHREAVPSIC